MKLGRIERWFVNSPVRQIKQHLVMQWFKGTVAVQAGRAILEIGCGRGVGARLIYETYQPIHLYLLDLDPEMIKKASRRLNGENKKSISLCIGDAAKLPIKDDSLDADHFGPGTGGMLLCGCPAASLHYGGSRRKRNQHPCS